MSDDPDEKHTLHLRYFTNPVEVSLNKNLDRTSLLLFPLIDMLDNSKQHCYASNAYLANLLNTTPWNISTSLALLIEQGYVEQVSFDGRKRVIKINKDFLEKYKHLREEIDDKISGFSSRTRQTLTTNPDKNEDQGLAPAKGSFELQLKEKEDSSLNKKQVFKGASHLNALPPEVQKKKILINRNAPLVIEDGEVPVKPLFHKPKKTIRIKKTDDILDIIDHWKSRGLTAHQEGSISEANTVKDIKEVLAGTLFHYFKDRGYDRKFTVKEIKQSVDNFALCALNRDYMPMNKEYIQRVKFCDFFYDPKKGADEDKSLFLKHLFNKPTLVSNSRLFAVKDDMPKVTDILLKWYKQKFGNRDNGSFSIKNRNEIVYSGRKLKEFYEENKSKLRIGDEWKRIYGQSDEVAFLAVQLTRALDKELRENETLYTVFHTGWLASDKTMEERLPKFLRSESIMK